MPHLNLLPTRLVGKGGSQGHAVVLLMLWGILLLLLEEDGDVGVAEAMSYPIVFIMLSIDGFHAIVWVHGLINPFQEDPSN